MKDPNDFMLVESEGEQVKRLTAELALAKDALRIVQETSIKHAGKQNERIRSLEARYGELAASAPVMSDRISALEADLATEKRIHALASQQHADAVDQLSVELALRQTAEAYAAKNALLVIELTQANVDVADINIDLLVRSRELEDALREIETLGLAHKDPYVPGETFAKIAAAALRPPGTAAVPACPLCAEGVPLAQVGDVKIHIDSHGTRYCATSKKPAVKP